MKVYSISYNFETGLLSGTTRHMGSFVCLHSDRFKLMDEVMDELNSDEYPNTMTKQQFKTSHSEIKGTIHTALLENSPELFI